MRLARASALLLVLASAPAAAQETPASVTAPEKDPVVLEAQDKLTNDPAAVDAFAERLARSRLISRLTTDPNFDARTAAAKAWIKGNPADAAHLAIRIAADDAAGNTKYQDALLTELSKEYERNPNAEHGVFGRLRKTAKDSQLLKKQAENMPDDERRELLRTMFEGQGAESGKVLNMNDGGKAGSEKPSSDKSAATAFNGIYDRLGAGNLHGYSPQLLAMQNALSARRPPGAPALVETGKLDYATLSYPAYAMNYDAGNLEKRLRADRILALAKLARAELGARDWADPDLEAKLAAKVPGAALSPRLKRRAELAAKARAASAAFLETAAKSKNANAISKALLIELGAKQKETARWIAAAALEEELSRVDEFAGFPAPELLAAVDAAPAPADERAAYRRRGTELKAKIDRLKSNAEKALGLLESDAWAGSLAEVDRLVAENQTLKRNLSRDVDDYSRVPFAIASALVVQPRWRVMLDNLAITWTPRLDYSRGVIARRRGLASSMNIFGLIASGDAEGAHIALSAAAN
ncbi:MAG: hypothetical protein ACHQ49_14380 [Elusimicrobiota bacterium]